MVDLYSYDVNLSCIIVNFDQNPSIAWPKLTSKLFTNISETQHKQKKNKK